MFLYLAVRFRERIMRNPVKFIFTLWVICLAVVFVMALGQGITYSKVNQEMKQREREALAAMMPEADSFKEKSIEGIEYIEALKGKDLVGYGVKAVGQGYAGDITSLVGIDTNGAIKGVEILEHQETPGTGSKITEIKPGEKEPWFLKQFKGKIANELEVNKNIDAVTGATMSSRAVTDSIQKTVTEFLSKIKKCDSCEDKKDNDGLI